MTRIPIRTGSLWTARQRAAHSLHEISYRACFKPQLPRYFIERLTRPGDRVYDPFLGRGTTLIEAALSGRRPLGCDVNPLAAMLARPRLAPPTLDAVAARLASLPLDRKVPAPEDLLAFYHPQTLRGIAALRAYLIARDRARTLDAVDDWIRMVALSRLTGHSPGFLSVYTMPPNQAVSVKAQRRINRIRGQKPPRRDLRDLLLRKSVSLLRDCTDADRARLRQARPVLLTRDCAATPAVRSGSVALVVTSPPFLDVLDYAGDNWLRCWFAGIAPDSVPLSILGRVEDWQAKMAAVLKELRRVLKSGGHVAFEVGEVRGGRVRLEEAVIPAARGAGLRPVGVLIHRQAFTKTARCWGVGNNRQGTNTNRVVLLRK